MQADVPVAKRVTQGLLERGAPAAEHGEASGEERRLALADRVVGTRMAAELFFETYRLDKYPELARRIDQRTHRIAKD